MADTKIEAFHEVWDLRNSFSISRGSKSSVDVVTVAVTRNGCRGVGECVPYARYQQTVSDTLNTIGAVDRECLGELTRRYLNEKLPPTAARNALDCALWQLESRECGKPVWQIAGLPEPKPICGVYSLSLEPPDKLAKAAVEKRNFPLLKIKLGKLEVVESVKAVRDACPDSRIIVDANEAWDFDALQTYLPELKTLQVEMIEQPLHATEDHLLENLESDIPLCADESFHVAGDLERLCPRYDMFNIKLDKTGGLTEAIRAVSQIKAAGKDFMVGSMMSTSYSLAPAMLLAQDAKYVDLDSSVWLREDRANGIRFIDGTLYPADAVLWG